MSPISALLFLACIASVAHAFILYFPQSYASNDQSYLGEIDAYNYLARRLPIDASSDVEALEKRSDGPVATPIRRRSADGFRCPCIHKVCTYHCMSGK